MTNLDYTRHYTRWHPDTAEHHRQMRQIMSRKFENYLPTNRQAAILDVGCGAGFTVGAILDYGYANVYGIDPDCGQVAAAQRHGLPVFHVGDTITWLEAKVAAFDMITCFDVIEHVPLTVQVRFVSAMKNALKSGGIFVCSVPNASSTLAARWRYIDYTHCTSFTEDSLDFLLFHGGFSEIEVTADEERPRLPWLLRPKLRWWYLRQIFRALRRVQLMAELGSVRGSNVPVSPNLIAVARA